MAKEDIKVTRIYRKKLLQYLVALRDVAMETKFHMYDVLLDPFRNRQRKSQVMAAAIVSNTEVLNGDFSALELFTDYLHTLDDPSKIVSRMIHHDRVTVVMNAGEKHFFEHGECRLFDPDRKYLFKIIDAEILSHPAEKTKRTKTVTHDKGGHGVLENMENAQMKQFHTLEDAVILLYSFYIPCSIDFHNCAKLLHEFVDDSGHEMVIGYELVHHLTDEEVSLKWLNMPNIIVLRDSEMRKEIDEQSGRGNREIDEQSDMDDDADDVISEIDDWFTRADGVFANICDTFKDFQVKRHLPYSRGLCRKIMKEYNMIIR